jgi:aspartate/methionine/tyrosine aminotransferase
MTSLCCARTPQTSDGPNITAENILVFTGAQVALQTAAFALAKDCHTIVFTPGYQSTIEAAAHAGGEVTRLALTAANGWQVDVAAVAAAIRPDTRYLVLNEPYNPAGTLMSRAKQAELVALASQHGITVLCDEVYRLLEHDPEAHRLPAMCDAYHGGLSAATLSKPWGAGGVAIGWLAFQDLKLRPRLVDVQYFSTACASRASEVQALMVLRASEPILAKNRAIVRANLALLDDFLATHADLFSWVRPRAGAIGILECARHCCLYACHAMFFGLL